jgi:hypothetical protein
MLEIFGSKVSRREVRGVVSSEAGCSDGLIQARGIQGLRTEEVKGLSRVRSSMSSDVTCPVLEMPRAPSSMFR